MIGNLVRRREQTNNKVCLRHRARSALLPNGRQRLLALGRQERWTPAAGGHGRLRWTVARAAALPLRCLARLASCRCLRWFSRTF